MLWFNLPLGPLIEISFGKSNMPQNCFAHGPAPTITLSHLIKPLSVSTTITALEFEPYWKPFTFVQFNIITPSAYALLAKP